MKNKNAVYYLIAGFAAVSLCLVVFLIYPLLKDIKSTSRQLVENKASLALMETENRQLDAFRGEYALYRENLEKINAIFVDQKNPIDAIKFLEKMAADYGISITINVSPSKNQPAAGATSAAFQIYAKGQFTDIMAFVENVELGPYLIKVNSMNLKKAGRDLDQEKIISGEIESTLAIEVITK